MSDRIIPSEDKYARVRLPKENDAGYVEDDGHVGLRGRAGAMQYERAFRLAYGVPETPANLDEMRRLNEQYQEDKARAARVMMAAAEKVQNGAVFRGRLSTAGRDLGFSAERRPEGIGAHELEDFHREVHERLHFKDGLIIGNELAQGEVVGFTIRQHQNAPEHPGQLYQVIIGRTPDSVNPNVYLNEQLEEAGPFNKYLLTKTPIDEAGDAVGETEKRYVGDEFDVIGVAPEKPMTEFRGGEDGSPITTKEAFPIDPDDRTKRLFYPESKVESVTAYR